MARELAVNDLAPYAAHWDEAEIFPVQKTQIAGPDYPLFSSSDDETIGPGLGL